MDRIRLCIITPEFLPVWGGLGTYTVELVKHMPNDVEIHVVAPMRESFGKDRLSTSAYDFEEYFGKDVRVHLVSKATDTFMYNASFQLACMKDVPRLLKDEQIDLIHYSSHIAGLLLQLRKLDVPAVTTIHTTIHGQRQGTRMSGMSFGDLEFSEKATYLAYPILRFAEIAYFSRPRYYITVSDWMKGQLQEERNINRSPIFVVRNSVDTQVFSPGDEVRSHRKIVLFTGRIIAAKGIKYLVEAMPEILARHPEAFFAFIGAGNSLPYQKRLKDLGIPEQDFAFHGYLKERSELIKYFRSSSVYVAPTLYENLPIRILEAMACGVPVVASNVCAIPEVIDNGVSGILVPPGSVKELTSAVCSLLEDSDYQRKIGENARRTVLERFDCRANVLRTVEVYKKVLSAC